MTGLFLLIAGTLVLIAFLFVLPPLWRTTSIPGSGDQAYSLQDQQNIAIARLRLTELKAQLQAGVLSLQEYEQQQAELELTLNDDLDLVVSSPIASKQGRWAAPMLIVLIPMLAFSLYWMLGNYPALNPVVSATNPDLEKMRGMVAGLAERLQKQPEDSLGWTMLGRSYKYLQDYPKAVDAFAHAYQLLGDQPEILLLYAEALAYANNEQLAGKPVELINKALAIEPNNTNGLWFAGMASAQSGDLTNAAQTWEKLLALLPADSPARQEIQDLLGQLANQPPAEKANGSAAVIDVQVSLTPTLQSLVKADDTLFIYAQALSGPKMPLAIIRKQVSDLPLHIQLTEAMAAMPNASLSQFPEVRLIARISKTGDAQQQPGDLIGTIEPVTVSDNQPHSILINEVNP